MTNKEFDEKYVGDNIRVHCPTKALNDEFISLATSFGYKVTDYWYDERSQTCYNVGCDRYCNIAWYLADGCDVVEFKSEGLKRLLKVGRVVELRDGTMGFLLEDRIVCEDGWCSLTRFDENLKYEFGEIGDIMNIYDSPIVGNNAWNFGSETKMFLDMVWERKEAKVFEILDVENVILGNLDDSFKYIARNHNGTLNIYKIKPTKHKVCWVSLDYTDFSEYDHLFDYIKWEDKEPTLIEDLIKMKTVAF